ncbi:MAG: TIR domain-containing protein [Chloroflexi bacterium]|nr:MAG: TIR domain-containing protein [Chloroflexota bacterium]
MKQALKLFYSYAPEDETLRQELDKHLALLKREHLIDDWHHKKISAGGIFQQEIDHHLQSAHIILLLISPDFIASDYCYSTELQTAIKRYREGTACVVPILLRPCDWKTAIQGDLQALPSDERAVTTWPNQDVAFAEITRAIREMISELKSHPNSNRPRQTNVSKRQRHDEGISSRESSTRISTPDTAHTASSFAALNTITLRKMIDRYYRELHGYQGKADYELAVRSAFQNLLAETARLVKWTLIPEQKIEGGIRPDGVLRDSFDLRLAKKKADGYPLINTIFENTKKAVLYQNKKPFPVEYDLSKPNDITDLLRQFFTYTEPDIENFEAAVREFKERIPELAQSLLNIIAQEHKLNKRFTAAFDNFTTLCCTSLDPTISTETIDEMLVQHLLTERLFRTVFNNHDFVDRNVIAVEIEKVIQALAIRSFNRHEFLKSLDRFYVAIEGAAKGIESWSERQHFLNIVYERFFQGFSVKQADTHGIVYTPQEIVDFMCASIDEALQREFHTSLAEPGVQILDPATGTGSFIVNLVHRIPRHRLKYKYQHDLFCNEITLLPYYIASLNIEHEYYTLMKEYEPFAGICFADTLALAEGLQMSLFAQENTERVKREKEAQITVVIGNPPYNLGQKSENENNKNRPYPKVDERIKMTYGRDSQATLTNKLYDAYVKFFRWATDRLQGRDGIVCLITNNSFIDQIAFDGMRKHLLQDFTHIYHLDLHGNVRKNPQLSGTTHNVFGIQVGVGITIAVRNSQNPLRSLKYFRVPEFWSKLDKLAFLSEKGDISHIDWQELHPDKRYFWITERINPEFDSHTFLPMGTKEAKSTQALQAQTIFKTYSLGVVTSRDEWVYDFSRALLKEKLQRFITNYNSEVFRWSQEVINHDLHLLPKESMLTYIDNFVNNTTSFLKWTDRLKEALSKQQMLKFESSKIRVALYRPFCKQFLYFDHLLNQRRYQQYVFFPTPASEQENVVICVPGLGDRKGFGCLATNVIATLDLAFEKAQCFPYYTYAEDGSNRRENITDWVLKQFQAKYGIEVTKWDIFHYVYAILHRPQYRERYAENLKHSLPRIPPLQRYEAFMTCVRIGKQLMDLHVNYEQKDEYRLALQENKQVPFDWRITKMKLTPDKTAVVVNECLTLVGVPPECFQYRLGGRSALEWVIDQYQVTTDKRSGIESDPNRVDDEQYIVHLVGRVITVSVETVKLVNALAEAVMDDPAL